MYGRVTPAAITGEVLTPFAALVSVVIRRGLFGRAFVRGATGNRWRKFGPPGFCLVALWYTQPYCSVIADHNQVSVLCFNCGDWLSHCLGAPFVFVDGGRSHPYHLIDPLSLLSRKMRILAGKSTQLSLLAPGFWWGHPLNSHTKIRQMLFGAAFRLVGCLPHRRVQ